MLMAHTTCTYMIRSLRSAASARAALSSAVAAALAASSAAAEAAACSWRSCASRSRLYRAPRPLTAASLPLPLALSTASAYGQSPVSISLILFLHCFSGAAAAWQLLKCNCTSASLLMVVSCAILGTACKALCKFASLQRKACCSMQQHCMPCMRHRW